MAGVIDPLSTSDMIADIQAEYWSPVVIPFSASAMLFGDCSLPFVGSLGFFLAISPLLVRLR
jgi:hypothetical protein